MASAQVVPVGPGIDREEGESIAADTKSAKRSTYVLLKASGRTVLTTALSYFDFFGDLLVGFEFPPHAGQQRGSPSARPAVQQSSGHRPRP